MRGSSSFSAHDSARASSWESVTAFLKSISVRLLCKQITYFCLHEEIYCPLKWDRQLRTVPSWNAFLTFIYSLLQDVPPALFVEQSLDLIRPLCSAFQLETRLVGAQHRIYRMEIAVSPVLLGSLA